MTSEISLPDIAMSARRSLADQLTDAPSPSLTTRSGTIVTSALGTI